ncbi:MAG: tRNA (N(6)-L-threonylcarbamoyladenosine(37)-C(2))-methylthiotransferase MtaB [Tissierellia bacterium]|nr:tRNA (N(6)-L-threonylcarbamoyladenosine(37)-C(2))-methylthiotransferase MtaB [Tissierellia bacterium]
MQKTFTILTLGCKVNQYESESMAELFEKQGYLKVDNQTDVADVYIVNTCTVTNLSDRKSRQFIRRAKRENPDSTVAVVGCYSQVAPEEVASIEGVDVVIGTTERDQIVQLVEEAHEKNDLINIVRNIKTDREFQHIEVDQNHEKTRSYMKVQDGCNRYCTYCIIPYARGNIRSRSIEDSVREAKRLAQAGYREIILTGIHIGSYGYDLGKKRLIDLIEAISKVEGIDRIRLSSVEPNIMTEEFMKRGLATGKLCDHFHLSLQSGSNHILKKMNRKYTREEYLEKAEIIKKYMPYAGLTTDIIVGFPGERDDDFKETLDLVEQVGFSRIHVFKYSKRKDTPAAEYPDQIHGNIKKERSEILMQTNQRLMKKFIQGNQNRILKVLFEEYVDDFYEGYTTNYIRVKTKSSENLQNKIRNVKIIDEEEIAPCVLV